MRRYAIQSVRNMRDIGGAPTVFGGPLHTGRFIRSDCPDTFLEEDRQEVEDLGITHVIDLRPPEEAVSRPSWFSDRKDVTFLTYPFSTGNAVPMDEASIGPGYFHMMEDHRNVRRILETIAHADGAVLVHCAVGKDRTGVVTAILLGVCGVPLEDIIADYQISHTYLKARIDRLLAENPDWPRWRGQSKPEYMREALTLLFEKYGSFEAYAEAAGIGKPMLHALREKLIDKKKGLPENEGRLLTLRRYREQNTYVRKGQIVLAGSSLMEQFPINELQFSAELEMPIYNRGISGDRMDDLLADLDTCILSLEPAHLYLNIGSNDIASEDYEEDQLMAKYERLIRQIQESLPTTSIHLLSYYPVNEVADTTLDRQQRQERFGKRNNTAIGHANQRVSQLARQMGLSFIDVSSILMDDEGRLKPAYTLEGIHLLPHAYREILQVLTPHFRETTRCVVK